MTQEINETNETNETKSAKSIPLASIRRTEADTLEIHFADGSALSVDPSEFSEDIQAELMLLGTTNKLRDSWASAKNDVAFAIGAANKTLDNLKAGLWTASRASGERVNNTGELVQAIANIKSLDVEKVREIHDAASEEERAVWRKNKLVKAEIAAIRAIKAKERAAKATAEDAAFNF